MTEAEIQSTKKLQGVWWDRSIAFAPKPVRVESEPEPFILSKTAAVPKLHLQTPKGLGLLQTKLVTKAPPKLTGTKRPVSIEIEDDIFSESTAPAKKKTTTTTIPKKPTQKGLLYPQLSHLFFCLDSRKTVLLTAEEGAKQVQKDALQVAAKAVKGKVDKEAAKKASKTKSKKREREEEPELEIPEAIKQQYKAKLKKEKGKQTEKAKAKSPGILKVATNVLGKLKPFRSHQPIFWDPAVLVDAPASTAVRGKKEEHLRWLTDVNWAAKAQPTTKEWLVFIFQV